MAITQTSEVEVEVDRTGFQTVDEPHPSAIVPAGKAANLIGVRELRDAIPAHCFRPSTFKSLTYLARDLFYVAVLVTFFFNIPAIADYLNAPYLTIPLYFAYAAAQGIIFTGLWILAHECGHSSFSHHPRLNDTLGFTLHSFLLTPYFSWKSTHRRHHIYANNLKQDHNYVPPLRDQYAAKLGLAPDQLDELVEDAPIVLFTRIMVQQLIGWNWYIISNITCPPSALIREPSNGWRNSHFDPWGTLFRASEQWAIILSDLGCFATLGSVYAMKQYLGSWTLIFWLWCAPWLWVNHWIVMITYLHHTHPSLPKYSPKEWTFMLGATATMDRDFGIIGTHFFHRISSDHVTHHLFSKIPHYYAQDATNAIVPLLGDSYKRGGFGWAELKLAFSKCQWVDSDEAKDEKYFGTATGGAESGSKEKMNRKALWYKAGPSPVPEYRQRMPMESYTGEKRAL